MFEVILFDMILILFPLFSYFFYLFYSKTIDIKKNNLIFEFALFSMYYLLLKFGYLFYHNIPLILFDIILFLAYKNGKKVSIIIYSIINIYFYYNFFNFNLLFLLIEYIFLFVIYFKTKNINYLICLKTLIYFNLNTLFLAPLFLIISLFVTSIFDKSNEINKLNKLMEDINSEEKEKESLFKITHEIKNPIAVIKGYLDMFDVHNKNHAIKYIPIIKDEINRVLTLMEDFLSINKIKINQEEMDLDLLIVDVIDSLKLILKAKKVTINYDSIDDIYIMGDYNRLKQVLINVIKNSVEANASIIDITLEEGKKVKLKVKDNGIGMSKDTLDNIKNIFFTTKVGGTGLGVYLSNEIILKHKGKMEYKSDIGTEVLITLPIKKGY